MNVKDWDIEELLEKEWLETNGLGGYASSSITGANTRKYHGLLVAPENPPTERKVLVPKVEERILQEEKYSDIAVNQYPNVIHPNGNTFLKTFSRRPIATWDYTSKSWGLRKKVFMVSKSNTTVLLYENTGKKSFVLELHPLLAHKDYHATSLENDFDFYYERQDKNIKVHAYPESSPLFLNWSRGEFIEDRCWYKDIQLQREYYRGQDGVEDYYRIGYIKMLLKPGQRIHLILTTETPMLNKKTTSLEKNALKQVDRLKNKDIEHTFYNDLLVSGNQFLVHRASTRSKTIIAGYHWFTDWGRDTMIAMRGLTIATGDQEASKSILTTFFRYLDKGMIPNRFPDHKGEEVAYNTIDATLWLFIAMYEYHMKFNDGAFIQKHLKDLESILLAHIEGTRYTIQVTDEGFLSGGEEGLQLTWMDAKVGDYVVTPRIGCPVEINALWYNALCIYEYFCGDCSMQFKETIGTIKKRFDVNFKKYFMSPDGYLYDFITGDKEVDSSFRPNQIYAVSLPFSLLTKKEEKKLVQLVGDKLLTKYGLRTLDPEHPKFVGRYGGDQWDRDAAYHEGTVWPFLLMEYWEAYLKVNGYSVSAKKKVVRELQPLKQHFYESDCLYGISEIFDGLEPSAGRGCVQQAWSVAALIKLFTTYELYNL